MLKEIKFYVFEQIMITAMTIETQKKKKKD